ncbi:hypothetical protein J7K93_02830 [bacterium]|nr:hypothetical protein [bacterium]
MGGSDPAIVCKDADIEYTSSRYLIESNNRKQCIIKTTTPKG